MLQLHRWQALNAEPPIRTSGAADRTLDPSGPHPLDHRCASNFCKLFFRASKNDDGNLSRRNGYQQAAIPAIARVRLPAFLRVPADPVENWF